MSPSKMPVLADSPLKRSVPSAGSKRSAMGASVSTSSPQSNLQQVHAKCKPRSFVWLDKQPVQQADRAATAQMASGGLHRGRQGQLAVRNHLRRASCRSTAQDTASLGSANATMKTPSRSCRGITTTPTLQEASRAAAAEHSKGSEDARASCGDGVSGQSASVWRRAPGAARRSKTPGAAAASCGAGLPKAEASHLALIALAD